MYIELTLMDVTLLQPTPNNECEGLIMLQCAILYYLFLTGTIYNYISSNASFLAHEMQNFKRVVMFTIIINSNTTSKLKCDCFANMIIRWSLVLYSPKALLNLKITI